MNSSYNEYIFLYMNGYLSKRDEHFLEHNDGFMRAVMLSGKSYKFFDKCSKDIRNDGEFLEQLVPIYKNDHKFLSTMVGEYCNNNPKEVKYIAELNILLDEIYEENLKKGTIDMDLYPAHINADNYYDNILESIKADLEKPISKKEKENAGYGFIKVDMSMPGSDIVKRFVASRMIKDILTDRPGANFEELIHSYFSEKESIIKKGDRRFLYDIIGENDKALRDYLFIHTELLDPYVDMLKNVIDNWDDYLEGLNNTKIDKCYDEMEKYINDNELSYNLINLFRGIVDLSIHKKKINKYLDEDYDYERVELSELTIPEVRFVKHMKEYMDFLFSADVIDPSILNSDEENTIEDNIEEKEPSKVLRFDFVNKKRIK